MQPLEVILTPPLEAYIAAKVAANRFPNASAVIREAVGRMQADEKNEAEQRARAEALLAERPTGAARPSTLLELYRGLQAGVALDEGAVKLLETEFVGRLPALLECCCKTDRRAPSPQLAAYCAKLRDRFGG